MKEKITGHYTKVRVFSPLLSLYSCIECKKKGMNNLV